MGALLRFGVVSGALAAFAACTLPSAGEFATAKTTEDASAPRADGGVVVVPPPSDASSDAEAAASDSGTEAAGPPILNLLPVGVSAYEEDRNDCGGAGGYLAAIATSTAGHASAHSCGVCRAPDQPNAGIWSIDLAFGGPLEPGVEYQASAWVRRPPGSPDALSLGIVIRTHDSSYQAIDTLEGEHVILTDEWQQLTVSLPLTKNAPEIDTYVYANNKPGLANPCFLIDDYIVWRSK